MRANELEEGPLDYLKGQAADIKQHFGAYQQTRAARKAAAGQEKEIADWKKHLTKQWTDQVALLRSRYPDFNTDQDLQKNELIKFLAGATNLDKIGRAHV